MATRFLLIRHGQSTWNADGRWQGLADPPLTDAGRQQAFSATASVGIVDLVLASPLIRANETAEIIAGGIGVGPVRTDTRLVESDAGAWTGMTRHEIEAGWPGWLAAHRRPDDFEKPELVAARASACLRDYAAALGRAQVLVLTHSGVIRCLDRALGITDGLVFNLAGRWYDVDDDGVITPGERMSLISDAEVTPVGPAHTENA
jgi:broad specificity phosphatase PhoE